MTVNVAAGAAAGQTQPTSDVIYASSYTPGWASNASGKDDTAALNQALTAARATTTGVGTLILDAATYFISGPLDCHNVRLVGQGAGSTRITLKSDWASGLPCNAQYALDQMPSVALGAPTQNAVTQAAGSSAYTLNQVVSAWVTASNSRNGGETPVSGMQQITIAANSRAPTFNWTAITGADATTTYNVYLDRSGGTNSANAVKVASGQTGTSYTDATGTGGSGHPPTTDTTGGIGILAPDSAHGGAAPNYPTSIERLYVNGPGSAALGAIPAHVSGIHMGSGTIVDGVITGGVFAGIFQNFDHEAVYRSRLGGYYGIYRGTCADNGDQAYENLSVSGSWACFGLTADAQWGGAHFTEIHCSGSPFGIYKESIPPTGQAVSTLVASACPFINMKFESMGNGNIFNAGSVTAAVTDCSFIDGGSSSTFDSGNQIPTTTQDWQGVAISRANAPVDLNGGPWKNNTVMGGDPSGVHPGVTTYTCGIAAQVQGPGGDYEASNLIARLRTDGKPWSTATAGGGDTLVRYNGAICRLYRAAGTISQGDLVMVSGGAQAQVVKSTGTAKVVGVALLAASLGQSVLVAQSGIVPVNSSANTIAAGAQVLADVSNNGAVVSGTPAILTNVGYAVLANSGGFTTVQLQGLL